LALGVLVLLTVPVAAEDDLDWDAVRQGKITIDVEENESGVKGVRSYFLVEAPPDEVYANLKDTAFFEASYESIEDLEVLQEYEDGAELQFTVLAVVVRVTYSVDRRFDDNRRRVYWYKTGGDLEEVSGSWTVLATDDPNESLVQYLSFVELDSKFMSYMYRRAVLLGVRSNLRRLRDILAADA